MLWRPLLLLALAGLTASQDRSVGGPASPMAGGPDLPRGGFGATHEPTELSFISPTRVGEAGGSRLYLHGTGLDAW